jgi:glycosyltransferase involved in cell wall biosynthesis
MPLAAAAPSREPIEISVLIARASRQDPRRIEQTLNSLRAQRCDCAFEVIVVDRIDDDLSAALRRADARWRWITVSRDSTLPQMRSSALQAARGRIVVVTEDHCVAAPDWLQRVQEAFVREPAAVAVGGCVVNGLVDSAFDWATYLCEYAAFAPPLAADAPLVGTNTAYLRERLVAQSPHALVDGFWESTVHPALQRAGHKLLSNDQMRVSHCKRFTLRGFINQRCIYSRHYAGSRFAPDSWTQRMAAALLSPLLPALLAVRLARVALSKPDLIRPSLRAAPYLLLFYLVWACGEMVGYAVGPGDSLRKIE